MVKRKTRMISMRLTEDQYQTINAMVHRIRTQTGFRVTRASLMQKLMHLGLPQLEREFPNKGNQKDRDW